MSRDGFLPPGATEHQLRRHLDGPAKLRCVSCGLDYPAGQLDEDEVCEECRRDRVNEDAGEER